MTMKISEKDNTGQKETIIQVIRKSTGNTNVVLNGQVKGMSELYYKVKFINGEVVKGILDHEEFPDKNFSYEFNERGIKIKEIIYRETGLACEQYFDDKGKLIELCSYEKDGKSRSKTIYTNDENGNNIETCSRNTEEKIQYRSTCKYDKRGNRIEYKTFSSDGQSDKKHIYVYDENNFRIEYIVMDGDGSVSSRHTIKNDEKGNNIEEKVFLSDGRLANTFITDYEYDDNGNVIHPLRKIPPGGFHPFHTYEYEYDDHNNWIKKITFYNKVAISIGIREINYFGEEQKDITVIIEPSKKVKKVNNIKKRKMENIKEETSEMNAAETEMTLSEAQWVAELSKGDEFSAFRYFVVLNKSLPSEKVFLGQNIDALSLKEQLEENMDAYVLHTYNSKSADRNEKLVRYTIGFPNNCYFVQAIHIQQMDADEFDVPDFIMSANDNAGTVNTSQLKLLHPSDASGKRDLEFENLLDYYFGLCELQKMPDKPEIFMVEVNNGNFTLQSHSVDDNFEIKDLDVNYGFGFEKFHNELMHRFNTSNKGLVLFHGEPGTGKTYYIRHLLRLMASNNKIVIYMPPNMVDHLVEPSFMTFISRQVTNYSQQGYFCVLLIEDAEPLLAKRQEGVRIQGVTNLLNMSDGLLNDMLNLQIICTFNVDLKKLDSALLREGRLIARKEFKALSVLDANLLASRLGIKHHFTKPATLGQIYAKGKNKNTLIHDVEQDRDASTNIDDL